MSLNLLSTHKFWYMCVNYLFFVVKQHKLCKYFFLLFTVMTKLCIKLNILWLIIVITEFTCYSKRKLRIVYGPLCADICFSLKVYRNFISIETLITFDLHICKHESWINRNAIYLSMKKKWGHKKLSCSVICYLITQPYLLCV